MSEIAIRVENLSKRYFLRHQRAAGDGLRHVLQQKLTAPFRWMRKSGVPKAESERRDSGASIPTSDLRPSTSEEFWALKDVSFEIRQGEVVGIIGRNGAGKSTLLKVLSRITEPTSGRITIDGRVASLLEVGTGFHPELTGRENIFLNGAILGMSRVEMKGKFDEIVAFAEVERFLDTPVKRYSSGMYVRLAFAVAAHVEPEILIVDEVLAVGDAQFQKKCLGKIHNVAGAGRTVLFVSHNMAALEALCSRAILLSQGSLVSEGTASSQVARYLEMSGSETGADLTGPLNIGGGVRVVRLSIAPDTLATGTEAQFELEMESEEAIRYEELSLLIYSPFGVRAGIVDLRGALTALKDSAARHITVAASVKALPLVEGEYFVGLWVRCTRTTGEFLNLTRFTVTSRANTNGVVPYPPVYRGTVELEFETQINADGHE